MAIACDAASVTKSSACFACLQPAQLQQVDVYLLQQGAGLTALTNRQLAAGGAPFRPLGPKQLLATIVYSLAVAAGGSKDPKTLAKLAACFVCSSETLLDDTETFLLASAVGGSTDPKVLLAQAKNYGGLYGQTDLIKAYLYNAIAASAPTSPAALFKLAACFMCLPTERLKAVRNYLLCQIVLSGGFTGQRPNLVPPGSIYSGTSTFDLAVNPNTCYQVCWGPDEVSVSLTNTKQLILSTGAGTCTNIFTGSDTVMHFVGTAAGLTVTATVKGCQCVTCPPQPYNFTFANDLVGGTTTASWGAYPPGMVKTELWTSGDNITYALAATVNAPTTTASVAQPTAGNFLWGKVRHFNASNQASNFTSPIKVSGLLNGLVSWWNMDSIQSVPNGQIDNFDSNNVLNNTGPTHEVVQLANGLINGAGDWHTNFAGSPYLKLTPCPASLRLGGANSCTIALWVQFKAITPNAGIMGVFNPASEYLLWQNLTPQLEWNVRNAANTNVPLVIGNQTLNVWHLIVVGVDNANSQIFYSIDGGARVNAACVGTLANQTPAFEIGNYADGFPSDAYIDEVGWWNRVLNAAEITFLYNGGSGKTLPL